MMRGGFPDLQWTLEEMIAEGDKVAARFIMRGTHRGTFFGVPPTGRYAESAKADRRGSNHLDMEQGTEFIGKEFRRWKLKELARNLPQRVHQSGSLARCASIHYFRHPIRHLFKVPA
jgi:hypothetical protein